VFEWELEVFSMEVDDLPEDTSGTDGRGRKPKHLCLSSSKPDISSILGVVLERRD
jgi:hypothetical protein